MLLGHMKQFIRGIFHVDAHNTLARTSFEKFITSIMVLNIRIMFNVFLMYSRFMSY